MKMRKAIIVLLALTFPLLSWAQVYQTDRPMPEKFERKLKPLPTGEKPQIKEEEKVVPDEDAVKFLIKEIKIIGIESYSPEEFDFLVEKYEGKEISLEELNILCKEIEREYLRRGIIAVCFTPPQDIKEGIVTLQVIEAKMGKLEVEDHKYFRKKRIDYYWTLEPGDIMRYDKISKSLQLMNANPDREVKATLKAGQEPETTDVHLGVTTYPPIHLTSYFDNQGVTSTGHARYGYGLRHNNLLGFDDSLIAGYTYGSDFDSIYAYHSIPVTNFGTTFMYGYSYNKSFPKKELTPLGIDSRSRNTSIFLYQDIFNRDNYIGEVYAGLDVKDKTTTTNAGTLNRDRLRILRLGGTFIKQTPQAVIYFEPQLSQGLHAFGARSENSLSSRDADDVFTKLNLDIEYMKALPLGLQGVAKLSTQLASTKLTPQEQFYLGGLDSVRGYPPGDFSADDAVQLNLELFVPAFFIPERLKVPYAEKSLRDNTTFLVFFDYGWGHKRGHDAAETIKDDLLMSVGTGVRFRLFNQTLLRLEWGFPVGDDSISEAGDSRFNFSVDFQEQLPRELARIRKERAKVKEESQEKTEINDMYKQAVRFYKNKQYEKAYRKFREIQAVSPGYARTDKYLKITLERLEKEKQLVKTEDQLLLTNFPYDNLFF